MNIEVIDISKIQGKKILAIGAHPDDLEFGAGATISLLSQNNPVSFLIATDGRMGTHNPEEDLNSLVKTREAEAASAAHVLGVKDVKFWRYPDASLSSYEKNFRRKLIKYLIRVKPDIIFSPDPWGRYEPLLHPDHRVVAWAVVECVLFATLPLFVKRHGLGAGVLNPKPEIWLTAPSEPNLAVDVTAAFPKKILALERHPSQFDEQVPFERAKERITSRAKDLGSLVNVSFAEVFRVLR